MGVPKRSGRASSALSRRARRRQAGTELYVSSRTGEVVRDTTASSARGLRGSSRALDYRRCCARHCGRGGRTVDTLAHRGVRGFLGGVLGVLRFVCGRGRHRDAFGGWHAWHHWLGIASMTFVLTWIVSGWLSMDHGRLFSSGKPNAGEVAAFQGKGMQTLPLGAMHAVPRGEREIEWFLFDGRVHRRERLEIASQRLITADGASPAVDGYLPRGGVHAPRSGSSGMHGCSGVDAPTPTRPSHRCRGRGLSSRVRRCLVPHRRGRWAASRGSSNPRAELSRLYSALHTFDVPALVARPLLRSTLIVLMCTIGLAFSATAVVIAWRR